ncbi:MAG TPA: phytoene/squalene synthase family protein [Prolixibacteraceae bacterium]|nr:phytoene/squalene synthase family protein [Prolixibacteraceae bacterium]
MEENKHQDFDRTCSRISELITREYSTSFFSATRLLEKEIREAIFNIYGFVRFADEIVDTFHDFDKKELLCQFEKDYYAALGKGISLNPVLHSFQQTVSRYGIEDAHVQAFLSSMKSDLEKETYSEKEDIDRYIFGSADVVGLMCLKVFCKGDQQLYRELLEPAMKLGSAFQKVNFLRDLKNDIQLLGRRYFPELLEGELDDAKKSSIVNQIREDFRAAFTGMRKLPGRSKLAVYTAFLYYLGLLSKINSTPARKIMETRIRIPDWKKMLLLFRAVIAYKFKLI